MGSLKQCVGAAGSISRPVPKILGASWGTDDAVVNLIGVWVMWSNGLTAYPNGDPNLAQRFRVPRAAEREPVPG